MGQIHFESRTPAGYFALARREASSTAVVVGTLRLPPKDLKDAAGREPAMVIAHGSGGVDITASAGQYGRNCLSRGATIGGDAEARRRAPEDVAAFLRRVLRPETH